MPLPKIPNNFFEVTNKLNTQKDEITTTLRAARDSVYVINKELSREYFRQESVSTLKANVEHLKIIVNQEDIKNSEHDISDLIKAINDGEEALSLIDPISEGSKNTVIVDQFIDEVLNEQSK
jgi:hypothetical protein